ncbi:hypothetical protein FACS189443_6360 [Planctomycetales bacterium]|nr:hypothetical protein FACS189443_6360 [Planctomycetales bacterium]
MMLKRIIIGVNVTGFAQNSGEVQSVFREYGCSIRTRIGLHAATGDACDPNGLILIEFTGGSAEADELTQKLTAIQGIEVKRMEF